VAEAPAVRVRFRRTGGLFAGNALETTVSADELPAELQALAEELSAEALAQGPASVSRGADRYQYEFVVEGGASPQRAVVGDAAMPERLRPLVAFLERRATDERRRSRG
jgi:hypothetical protein